MPFPANGPEDHPEKGASFWLSERDCMELIEILKNAGYKTFEGAAAVKAAIVDVADISHTPLCSGWRVFPDGRKCPGCRDCEDR